MLNQQNRYSTCAVLAIKIPIRQESSRFIKEVNNKRRLDIKIIEDSARSHKLKVLWPTFRGKTTQQLQRPNKPPCVLHRRFYCRTIKSSKGVQSDFGLIKYHLLANITKGLQPAVNSGPRITIQAVNENNSDHMQPIDNPAAQTVQIRATCKVKIWKMIQKLLQLSKGVKNGWRNSISIFNQKLPLEQARFERKKP